MSFDQSHRTGLSSLTGVSVVILGDSLIGLDGDGEGGLGQALKQWLEQEGAEVLDVVGVAGSATFHWLHASDRQARYPMPGRWSTSAQRPLTAATRRRANLDHLASLRADVYLVNLGTNDAATEAHPSVKGRAQDRFAVDVQQIAGVLSSSGGGVVWTLGNGQTGKDYDPVKQQLAQRLREVFGTHAVLDPEGIYNGAGVHPSVRIHRSWIQTYRARLIRALTEQGRRSGRSGWNPLHDVAITAVSVVVAAVVAVTAHLILRQ